jgi:hypothetical protein
MSSKMSQREIKPQLNADEREILERLHQSQENSIIVCANDFSFGHDRFIRALDHLIHIDFIDSPLPLPRHERIGTLFSFKHNITTSDAKAELIKTDAGHEYLTAYPPKSPVVPN